MKHILCMIMALVLTVALLGCGKADTEVGEANVQTAMATAEQVQGSEPAASNAEPLSAVATTAEPSAPAAESGMPDVTVSGSAEGTVLAIAPNDITINMKNGNTINFMMNYISETEAVVGDEVKVEYSGDILNRPEAVTVTVTEKSPAQTLSGTVFLHDQSSVYVEISSQQVFGFVLNKDTVINGAADYVVTGDAVMLTYDGDLYDTPTAVQITITDAVKNRSEQAQPTKATAKPAADATNKTLDGVVKSVSATKLTMLTSRSKSYSFKINGDTRVTGNYALAAGARVTVYYDGYAAKSPLAKAIYVYAPADPNPTATPKPATKTASGYVDSFGGMYLSLTSGIGFDCAYATYSGNSDGRAGDAARVSYYVGSDGMNYATYITFTAVTPDPTPIPKPTPGPTRTASGIVTSFGGMYLSLDNGMGFDCAYASYSGDGDRLPGDEARVTYYVGDDGMNYATKIRFTSIYQAAPEPEWVPEPEPEPDWEPDPEPDPSFFEED